MGHVQLERIHKKEATGIAWVMNFGCSLVTPSTPSFSPNLRQTSGKSNKFSDSIKESGIVVTQ